MIIPEGSLELFHCHPPFDDSVFDEVGELDTSMVGKSGLGPVKVFHRLSGWEEVRREFRSNYGKMLRDETITDIIFDTQDDLWTLEQNSFKQRKQDELHSKETNLKRSEYEECNNDMLQYIMGAKKYSKNLILICHQSEIWSGGEGTGQYKPSGWNLVTDKSDITLEFRVRSGKPYAVAKKSGGASLELIDKEFNEPTVDSVVDIIEAAAFLRKYAKDEALPDEVSDILSEAKKLKFKLDNE